MSGSLEWYDCQCGHEACCDVDHHRKPNDRERYWCNACGDPKEEHVGVKCFRGDAVYIKEGLEDEDDLAEALVEYDALLSEGKIDPAKSWVSYFDPESDNLEHNTSYKAYRGEGL